MQTLSDAQELMNAHDLSHGSLLHKAHTAKKLMHQNADGDHGNRGQACIAHSSTFDSRSYL
jgi:hypothetical protein